MGKLFDKPDRSPADYEKGAVYKSWRGRVSVALVYPNSYHVGMSNLGLHTVYRLLNAQSHVVCERVFFPRARAHRAGSERDFVKPLSIESQKPITAFNVVAFSVAFENDFPNLLTILDIAGLPLWASDRNAGHPLIVAGGVSCAINPEPIAPFIDLIAVGEAELFLGPLFDPSHDFRFQTHQDRLGFLAEMARSIGGLYVPELYQAQHKKDGTLEGFGPTGDVPAKIKRVYLTDLSDTQTESAIITPDTTFDATHLIEVSRGCPHGCRFCAAGYIYRPPRFRPIDGLKKQLAAGLAETNKIGLVGAAVSDLPGLADLCRFAAQYKKDADKSFGTAQVSFSSLRADALDRDLIAALKAGAVKTATIAPDAGSARMRAVINKGLSEEAILTAVEKLVAAGIPNIKLYFMVGLPTEQGEDIASIVALCRKIKHTFLKVSRAQKRIGEITVSINSFVPKPVTPFQWVAMETVQNLKSKIKVIKNDLKKVPNVRIHADLPRWAYIQALLSRGDRRVADILYLAHQNNGNWAKTLKASPVNPDFYVAREHLFDELLPWDFIDHGVKKSFLKKEYQKALKSRPSPPCPIESCKICGVCKTVA